MATVDVPLERLRFGQTKRRDLWWAMPLTTFIVFSSFVVYVTWALFQGEHYHYGNYLSPLYSPELFGDSPHAVFGPWRWPWPIPFIKYSPAMLILVFPLAFRMTCYYYRGAYYKAFWADPPACAVGEPRNEYRGEAKWPLLIQNLHRYALYFALLFIVLLSIDVVQGFRFNDPATGHAKFGIGVGSLVLLVNVVLDRRLHPRLPLVPPPGGRHARHACRARPRARRPTTASAASTGSTRSGPGSAWSSSGSPTSTSACARWASSRDLRIL